MKLTYENLVRGVLFVLLIAGSFVQKLPNPIHIIFAFCFFEMLIRVTEKPTPSKDFSSEVKELQEKNTTLERQFNEIKNELSLGNVNKAFSPRR